MRKEPKQISDAIELYQLGCEYAQGYHFGEPMSADEARALLQAEAPRDHGDAAAARKRSIQ